MGALGDSGQLKKLIDSMRGVSRSAWRTKLMKVLSQEAVALSQECFANSKAPDGSAWAPLRVRNGQPLLDTGRLRNSINGRGQGADSFIVGTNVKYAALQNFGGTIVPKTAKRLFFMAGGHLVSKKSVTVPARPFFPSTQLPKAWEQAFYETSTGFLHTLLKAGG